MLSAHNYAYDLGLPKENVRRTKSKEFTLIKNIIDSNINKKSKRALITATLCMFTMLMVLTYRYNIISEKNYNIQKLNKELITVKSEFAQAQMKVDKLVDMDYVESIAKQQLGMQKPDKSQIVYVDMESGESVVKAETTSLLKASFEKIKGIFGDNL